MSDQKALKGFVIDPFKKTIEAVTWDGRLDTIYALTSTTIVEVSTVWDERTNEHPYGIAAIYVDEEGLYKQPQAFFIFDGANNSEPLAGKGLLVGPGNEEGDDTDCAFSMDEVTRRVTWIETWEAEGRPVS